MFVTRQTESGSRPPWWAPPKGDNPAHAAGSRRAAARKSCRGDAVADITHDADDFGVGFGPGKGADADADPERAAAGKVTVDERLVDDYGVGEGPKS